MKKISALILTAVFALTMFSGCGQKITESGANASKPAPQSFKDVYGDQLNSYLNHQYYFDGQEVPKQESNFYFINSFLELTDYAKMGYYPQTSEGVIDLEAPYPTEDYKTFGDYLVTYSENSIASAYIIEQRAKAEGITLPEETYNAIEEMFADLRNNKAPEANMSFDKYLQMYYGPGVTEASFKEILERYYLTDAYTSQYCEKFASLHGDEYDNEQAMVPNIRYVLFEAREGVATEAEKDAAQKAAREMMAECKTVDDIPALAEAGLASGIVKESNDIAVPKGQMVPDFEAWAWDESRAYGDIDVIYATYGYFVVGYLGTVADETNSAADLMMQDAMSELGDSVMTEINTGTHDFHTNQKYKVTSKTDILVAVFISLAAVCIVAVIVILINHTIKNGKADNKGSSKKDKSKASGSKNGKGKK